MHLWKKSFTMNNIISSHHKFQLLIFQEVLKSLIIEILMFQSGSALTEIPKCTLQFRIKHKIMYIF